MDQAVRGNASIKTNKTNNKAKSKSGNTANIKLSAITLPLWLKVITWILVAGVFVFAPYLNGLYFYNDFQYAAAAITVVTFLAGLWLWSSKTELQIKGFWKSLYPYFFLLGIVYLLDMIIRPAQMDYAVEGVVRYIALLGLVIMMSLLLQSLKEKKVFLGLLILTGAWTSVFALANGYGTLHFPGALFQPGNRLSSVFQYANTNASFAAAFLFIAFFYPILLKNKWLKIAISLATYVLLLNLTLTYSRGTWVTFAILAILMLVVAPKVTRLPLIISNIAPLVAFVATLTYQIRAVQTTHASIGWISLGAGVVATLVLSFVMHTWVIQRVVRVPKVVKIAASAVIFLAVVFVGYKAAMHGGQNSILTRLETINLQQQSVQERFVYYKDGLHMFADHPIFGDGFGTWTASFQKYQSYPYWSKHEHSYVIQLLVETGIAGILAFAAALVFYLAGIVRTIKASRLSVVGEPSSADPVSAELAASAEANLAPNVSNSVTVGKTKNSQPYNEQTILSYISLFVVASILAHASIDFDMSYGLMNFLLWGIMLVGIQNVKLVQRGQAFRVQALSGKTITSYTIGLVAMAAGLLVSITAMAANHYYTAASKAQKNPTLAYEDTNNARSLAKYNSQYTIMTAQISDQLYQQTKNVNYGKEAITLAQSAAQLAPYDPTVQMSAGQILYKYSQFVQALNAAETAYKDGVFGQQYPEQYMIYLVFQAEENLKKNPQMAKELATKAVGVYEEAKARAAEYKKLPPLPQERAFDVTDQMKLRYGEANLILGKASQAQTMLQSVVNSKDQTVSLTAKMALDVMMSKNLYKGQGYGLVQQMALAQQIGANPSVSHEYGLLK